MMLHCVNSDCSENGVDKELAGMDEIPPGIVMRCGVCGNDCEESPPESE